MKKLYVFFFQVSILWLIFTHDAQSEDLSVEISNNRISISSNFTGAKILLFGKVNIPGNVVIIVEGPKEKLSVRKKKQVLGIWINTKTLYFSEVPAYYALLSNKPINEITSEENLKKYKIKANFIDTANDSEKKIDKSELLSFKKALVRNKIRKELYFESENSIAFNDKLFRSWLKFPANAPEGNYQVKTYLFYNQNLISTKKIPLFVSKVGIERQIFDFAKNSPTLYGLTAIIIAILAGWLAAIIFRKT